MAWDISRRAVMGSGAAGLVAAGVGIGGGASAMRRTVVIEESSAPESRQFAEAIATADFSVRVIRVDRTLNGLLHELEDTGCLFAGLTSDPVAMIATQILAARGARPLLRWTHHYAGGRWRHQTEGAPSLLSKARFAWPTTIAHHLRDAIGGAGSGSADICNSGACALAGSSPGMLVSWVIEAGGQPS